MSLKPIKTGFSVIFYSLLAIAGLRFILIMAGYEFELPEVLADKIVRENKPAEDCYSLLTWDLGPRPPLSDLQHRCIREVAVLRKDPITCELMIPNEYGLACLSEVGGLLSGDIPCGGTYGRNEVYCNQAYSEGELLIQNPKIENCILYERNDLREWCHYKRTRTMKNIYECNQIKRISVYDECEEAYAFKQKDPSLCESVKDEKRKKYCEIRINTWLKYPDLRNSSYFGTPVPTD